jgi:CHAD domain-containing protein
VTTPTDPDPVSPEALVVHERMVELVDELAVCDSGIRRRQGGGVHRMRVTLRRLRSLLATFAPLYDESGVAHLRDELKWLAAELGGARDAAVVRERLKAIASTPEEREVVARVDVELTDLEAAGVEHSIAALDSQRHSEMLRELTALVADPPWTEEARRPEEDLVRRRVLRDWKRLRKRARRADDAERDAGRREALHETRKAAKRLRYASEALRPAYRKDAARLARRAKGLQTGLGDIQDHAVARELLRELAAKPGRDAHDAFVLGTFHADEDPHWAEAEEQYAESWSALARKKNRRWLTRPSDSAPGFQATPVA